MGSNFGIRAIPTREIAAELAQHCVQAPALIQQHNRALQSLGRPLERPSTSLAGLAECRDINQFKLDALEQEFQGKARALVREAQSQKSSTPSVRLNQQADALLERFIETNPVDAAKALNASKAHEERLIKEHGGFKDFILTASRAEDMFINIKNPNQVTQYYNDQIFITHSVITKNYGPLIKAAQERLQSAQSSFDADPNEHTRNELNEYADQLGETIDNRSHEWMKLQGFTRQRDEIAAARSPFDRFLDRLKELRDSQQR